MARKKKTATSAEAVAPQESTATLPAIAAATPGNESNGESLSHPDASEAKAALSPATPAAGVNAESLRAIAADPRPTISVALSDYAGGPSMHLLRSFRFRQMQIRFDQSQPDERHLVMLKRSGWTDRSESEGVWTKQIDPEARWQSVARMEQEFKAIANAIRKDRGMEPVLQALTLA